MKTLHLRDCVNCNVRQREISAIPGSFLGLAGIGDGQRPTVSVANLAAADRAEGRIRSG